MIKYTTLIGQFYDINKNRTRDSATVILHLLNPEDYIQVKDIYNRTQNIKVKTILKIEEDNRKEQKNMANFDFNLYDKEGNILDPETYEEVYLVAKDQSSIPLPEEVDKHYDDETTVAAFENIKNGEYDFGIYDKNGKYIDPKKYPELYIAAKQEENIPQEDIPVEDNENMLDIEDLQKMNRDN